MELNTDSSPTGNGVPFKVVDLTREKRKGVVAATLQDLIIRARNKMDLPRDIPVKIVLEQDGTEVDDDEYFSTMERNTTLMILINDQKWLPPGKLPRYQIIVDEPDSSGTHTKRDLGGLVERLQGDLTHISMLGGKDLELLSDMDPESLADIMPDKTFLEQLKEASGRFLTEKRQAQEAMELLKIYHASK
ncbi:DNA fragmentation factor subunit alpha-like isoform X1 [Zootermopsis nevadensis]|uniref:Cell death activator CIDE-A n=1 Tax=Zootermopsis nevadensis TaxID=136037 RepID=A0A067RRT3_ZOONE|nr:DNA fragmentation factor subunit alpha-like isoform X1 [Zootermopsis nevadensis]XP_021937494.1 DNA fragmentation factor subunit alpha-like isoform X1 [Zootermopsis nevadensis]XP_021937509.1 DNA fragmentation factor subunit alpha-like isoform X1 [Zootermopsis nevadensis]XP_021937517.1 DNA fragmentation factor subunit alpha-like isoform X1 [Zootermopsis nevadensis]XP_021937527.1 DNA fragmentation factor subunit alpha-like isoform X1 [Zootermopsis nevadensis]KDR23385.1 Cell death activator CID